MYEFCIIFFVFFIYSVLGFLIELFFCSLEVKKLVINRGYLIGPYCPIYGFAVVIMANFLRKYVSDPIIVFSMGALLSTTIEYLTSYFMEKIFKTRWWNYDHEPYNINGRVCLKNSVLFGIAALIVVYILNDWNLIIINFFDKQFFIIMNVIFLVIMLIDFVLSTSIILKLRKNSLLIKDDMTKEIKEQVNKELEKNFVLNKRVLNSFPTIFDDIRDIIKNIDSKRRKRKKG